MDEHHDRRPTSDLPPSSAETVVPAEQSEKDKALAAPMEEFAGKPLEEFTDVVPFDDRYDAADKIFEYVRGHFSEVGFSGA